MKFRVNGLSMGAALIAAFAMAAMLIPEDALSNLITNGDFAGGWYYDAAGVPPPDTIPNSWYKLETLMHGGPDDSHIGPAADGASLYWDRWLSDSYGDWTCVKQDLAIDITQNPCLALSIDILIFHHNLAGSGFTQEEWEFPANVVIYFVDTDGRDRFWHFGWYEHIDHQPPDGYILPDSSGIVYSRQVPYWTWCYETFDLVAQLRTLAEPAVITGILVGGSGWDFIGKADNVRIEPSGPSATRQTKWGSIKALYR